MRKTAYTQIGCVENSYFSIVNYQRLVKFESYASKQECTNSL